MGDDNGSENERSQSEEQRYSSDSRDSNRSWKSEDNGRSMSRKRPYDDEKDEDEDEDEDEEEQKEEFRVKRVARARDVVFRIVVPSREIGKVIGKQGSKIKLLREETRANIKIADPIAPLEERVIIISSKDKENKEKSPAEHALIRIVTAILEESGGNATTTRAGSRHVGPNMIRLLIAGSQAGSLIGMSGNNIKGIREDSCAWVQIMPQNHLPFCASASETDRLVQISGKVSQVLKALDHIGATLREHPPKEVISMRPTYYIAPCAANNLTLLPQSVLPGYAMQSGGLIGRGGSNISKVRSLSGATVKITGEKDETRTIYFAGTAEQVAKAQSLVNSIINVQQQT